MYKKYLLLTIAILVVVALSLYAYPLLFDKNSTEEPVPKSFPKILNNDFGGRNKEWEISTFQALVTGYESVDGNEYIRVDYTDIDGKDRTALVLFRLSEENLNKIIKNKNYQSDLLAIFRERYVDYLTFETAVNPEDSTKLTPEEIVTDFDNFKENVDKGTLVKFKIYSKMPDKDLRTNEYCFNTDRYHCLISALVDTYGTNYNDFWKIGGDDTQHVLIPYQISLNIILE